MRYACKRDLHDRCNGGWCTCPCHDQRLEGANGG
jgi:hypothetical protein